MAHSSARSLELEVRTTVSASVVRVRGSAGIGEAEEMRTVLENLASGPPGAIVLDLSEMDFICSSGLGAIIYAHLKARKHHGQIRLVNPQPKVLQLLETTRLTKLFSIYPTVEEALKP